MVNTLQGERNSSDGCHFKIFNFETLRIGASKQGQSSKFTLVQRDTELKCPYGFVLKMVCC